MNPQTTRWRILRRCLVGLAVVATLIGLFYTEENWRGKRAWDNCKRALEAKGVNLKWADFIPAPVPDDQNVFGVPEMQKWFVGRGPTELSNRFSFPGYGRRNRLTVAELTIGLPGDGTPNDRGAAVLHWGNPHARTEASRLIKDAVGPMATDPLDRNITLRSPEEIRPARILLQCQTAPTEKELLEFLPELITYTRYPGSEKIQVKSVGGGAYKVTMPASYTVAEYLKWSEQLEPEFTLIRKALQRPYARMGGDYSVPHEMPIPNYVTVRSTVQMLGAMTQCHLLQGKPEEALRDLTLMHDLCRIPEGSRPMTLVSAMLNVAVTGLYVNIMADGLRWRAWQEPQLAALEEQLKQASLLPPMKQSFETSWRSGTQLLEGTPRARLAELFAKYGERKNSVFARCMPRGWAYQNIITIANFFSPVLATLDPASQFVFPDKADALTNAYSVNFSSSSPYGFIAAAMVPNYIKALRNTAQNQTMVNQAIIACALERYHLAHGEYPETLDALAPQFITAIPHDVIGGKPLHYRRAADGTFLLYSVGWNGRDDGGVPGKTITDGDWVWLVFP